MTAAIREIDSATVQAFDKLPVPLSQIVGARPPALLLLVFPPLRSHVFAKEMKVISAYRDENQRAHK